MVLHPIYQQLLEGGYEPLVYQLLLEGGYDPLVYQLLLKECFYTLFTSYHWKEAIDPLAGI